VTPGVRLVSFMYSSVVLSTCVPSFLVRGYVALSVSFLCISVYSPLVPCVYVMFIQFVPLVAVGLVGSPGLVQASMVSYVSFQFPMLSSVPQLNALK